MTIPTISTLPTAPARTDAPATFISRADAFLGALVTMQSELNTSIGAMNTDFITIGNNVTAAQAAQTAAEAAQSAAETAETNAETAETNAETAQTAAEAAQAAAESAQSSTEAVYDAFDDRYLGAKASDPTLDNDGNALQTGAQYFNTTTDTTRVYNGSGWQDSAALATSITVSQISDLTANATELNYTDGVTSAIQAQLDGKEPADATILKDADINSTILGYVAPSASGNILTSDGTNWTSSAPSGGGLEEYITKVELTSSASQIVIDNSAFSSTDYDYLILRGYNFTFDSSTYMQIRYRSGGVAKTSQYGNQMMYAYSSTGYFNAGSATQPRINFINPYQQPNANTSFVDFEIKLNHLSEYKMFYAVGHYQRGTVGALHTQIGWHQDSTGYTFGGIEFNTSGANYNSGCILKLYGVKEQ